MARIKITDLARDQKVGKEELRQVTGGWIPVPSMMPRPVYGSALPRTGWIGIEPNPTPLASRKGWIGIEPNPTP